MRISTAADELTGVAGSIAEELRRRGHEVIGHGALAAPGCGERHDWAWASEAAEAGPSTEEDDRANVAHLREIEEG